MKRRAIQLASKTLVISLPSKWVKKQGISKGDELDIIEENSNLLISSRVNLQPKRLSINLSETGLAYKKIIAAAFKAGYDEFEIFFTNHEELSDINQFIRLKMTNFNIEHQSKDSIILGKLYADSFEGFDHVLRRYFLIMSHLANETLSAFEKNDYEWLKQTQLIKEEPDRLANYLRRNINRGFDIKFKRTAPLYVIIEMILFTADTYREICKFISSNSLNSRKDTIQILKELVAYQEKYYHLFYNFNIRNVVEFGEIKDELIKKIKNARIRSSKEEKLFDLFERLLYSIHELYGPLITLYI